MKFKRQKDGYGGWTIDFYLLKKIVDNVYGAYEYFNESDMEAVLLTIEKLVDTETGDLK